MTPRPALGAPTDLARRYVRYVRGFGVSIAIGLAPFLGKVKLPGFSALLEAVPFQIQDSLIPLSAFLMGLVAVAVQFYAGEQVAPARIRSLFGAGLVVLVAGLVLFIVFSTSFVERQKFGDQSVGVIVSDSRLPPPGCHCPRTLDDKACIQQLSLDEAALDSCWGGPSLRRRKLALSVTYLLLTGGFASLIGLLLLQEGSRGRRGGARAAPPAPARQRRRGAKPPRDRR
jgi:hypothetical protein